MDPHWKQALLAAGGKFAEDRLLHFGDLEAELSATLRTDTCTDLSQLGLIEVLGKDAREFLHALLTCDVTALAEGRSSIAAWCTAKGQVIAVLQAAHLHDRYLLLLPADLADAVTRRLQLYMLRREVTLQNRTAELHCIGIAGLGLPAVCAAHGLPLPQEQGHVLQRGALTALRLAGPHPRALFIALPQTLQGVWRGLTTEIRPVSPEAWSMLDILAGFPAVTSATTEKHLPQMLNLQCLGAVSFHKGCFPGQEVIARLQYRGQLKRRLYLASAETHSPPEPGSAVHDDREPIGEVLLASRHPEGTVLLAVMLIMAENKGELFLHHPGGISLRLRSLPYSLDQM